MAKQICQMSEEKEEKRAFGRMFRLGERGTCTFFTVKHVP